MKTNKRRKTSKPEVCILMGSDSDWTYLEPAVSVLSRFGIPLEVRVISAHRTPKKAVEYAAAARKRGLKVIIAAAGGAAHLAGVVAAHTILPVIGVPVKTKALDGLDSLLSTVQMPSGIPVATMTLGSAGPVNAGILAVQILALHKPELARQLKVHKKELRTKVVKGNCRVQEYLEKFHD